eukprot:4533319-Pyramimonas_sp.AAC.1
MAADAEGLIMFPLVVHTLDLVVSAAGILSVGGTTPSGAKQSVEDPYSVMKQVPVMKRYRC